MDEVNAVVIGAGVVGLAIAGELARGGHETLVLEAGANCGSGASARSSAVVHAGIYYPSGSLKARLCVAGREQLYQFCRTHGVAAQRCGKLLVACDAAQLPTLAALARQAAANGVELEWLDPPAAGALEPQLACQAALLSAHTGIIDSGAYLAALRAEAERQGARVLCRRRVTRIVPESGAFALAVNGADPALRTRLLVNSAGIDAPALAHCIEGFPKAHIPRAYFAQGSYFALPGRAPFRHLIYPLPEASGLGIHLTLDLAGNARFGPDVQWLEAPTAARVDPARRALFEAAVRRYWPGLPPGVLLPADAGIRARISGPGEPPADFRIDAASRHGLPGLLNLFGIESPGLTASLALASEAVRRLS
jgi:L-2-hydroxyglutarate oxidase LhgO